MWWKSKDDEHKRVINAPPPMPNSPVNIPINNVVIKANRGGTL